MPRLAASVIVLACSFASTAAPQQVEPNAPAKNASPYWLDMSLKARSMLVDPADGRSHEVMDPDPTPMGLLSPDGRRVAYIGSDPERVEAGHDFDLFVADVDPSRPSSKANARRLTSDQRRPVQPQWLSDSSGLVFQAGDDPTLEVWYIDLGPDSRPVRLSDGTHRCYDVSIIPESRVAWIVHKGSKNKQQFKDLVLHPSLRASGHMRTLLRDQHISSYAFSPNGRTLAWSGLGSMYLVDLQSGDSREVPLHGIHPQLANHTVHQFAWRPDGRVIAIRCGFLGGIQVGAGEEFPRMFAADKVFFVPVDWSPTPESLNVTRQQDTYPSPIADDPAAEVSPAAGDERRPWWIREAPERVFEMKWIKVEDAKRRISAHAAPSTQQLD